MTETTLLTALYALHQRRMHDWNRLDADGQAKLLDAIGDVKAAVLEISGADRRPKTETGGGAMTPERRAEIKENWRKCFDGVQERSEVRERIVSWALDSASDLLDENERLREVLERIKIYAQGRAEFYGMEWYYGNKFKAIAAMAGAALEDTP